VFVWLNEFLTPSPQAVRMVGAEGGGGTSTAIYSSLLRMLATCAAASPQVAHSLLELGLAATLAEALKGCVLLPSPSPAGPAASPSVATISRGSDQLTSLLQLLAQLLPPLPGSEAAGNREAAATRRALLAAAPNLVAQYGDAAASVLLQVYGVSTVAPVRAACLAALSRLLHYAAPQHLREVLAPLPLAAFLAGVIAGRDPQVSPNLTLTHHSSKP